MCVQKLSLQPTPTPGILREQKERKHIWEALGDKVAQFILLSVSIIIKILTLSYYICATNCQTTVKRKN